MPLRAGLAGAMLRRISPPKCWVHLSGVGAAHLMFGQALVQISQHARAGGGPAL